MRTSASALFLSVILFGASAPALGQTLDNGNPYRTPQEAQKAMADVAADWQEQHRPRKAIALDPEQLGDYVGSYEITPVGIFHFYREGGHFFVRETGTGLFSNDQPVEIHAEAKDRFFSDDSLMDFRRAKNGKVDGFNYHFLTPEIFFVPRISDAAAASGEAALKDRIRKGSADPQMAAALRRAIKGLVKGRPVYGSMTPYLADSTRRFLAANPDVIRNLGVLKSITFERVDGIGGDNYDVVFANVTTEWRILPLTADGKLFSISFHFPRDTSIPPQPPPAPAPYPAPPGLNRS